MERINATSELYSVDEQGRTLLHHAVINCDLDRVQALLLNDCSGILNLQDTEGNTALHYAVEALSFDPEVVYVPLEGQSIRSDTGPEKIIELLLAQGAQTHLENNQSTVPFFRLITKNRLDMMNLFLEKGIEHYPANSRGQTILGVAVLFGLPRIVTYLIEAGFDPNEFSKNKSLLFRAIQSGNICEHALLRGGIDVQYSGIDKLLGTRRLSVTSNQRLTSFLLYGVEILIPIEQMLKQIQEEDREKARKIAGVIITHLRETLSYLLQSTEIIVQVADYPKILHYLFSVRKRFDKANRLNTLIPLVYEYYLNIKRKDITDENNEALKNKNVLWQLRYDLEKPFEIMDLIIACLANEHFDDYRKYSSLSRKVMISLEISLLASDSLWSQFVKRAPNHNWEAGPLLVEQPLKRLALG